MQHAEVFNGVMRFTPWMPFGKLPRSNGKVFLMLLGLQPLMLCLLRVTCSGTLWATKLYLHVQRAYTADVEGVDAQFSLSVSSEAGFRPGVVPCSEVLRSMAKERQWRHALGLLQGIIGKCPSCMVV